VTRAPSDQASHAPGIRLSQDLLLQAHTVIRAHIPAHWGPQAPLDAAPPLAREFEARFAVAGKDLWAQWTALCRRAVRATPIRSIRAVLGGVAEASCYSGYRWSGREPSIGFWGWTFRNEVMPARQLLFVLETNLRWYGSCFGMGGPASARLSMIMNGRNRAWSGPI